MRLRNLVGLAAAITLGVGGGAAGVGMAAAGTQTPGAPKSASSTHRPATSNTGPAKADQVFVPLTPCRIFDTRHGGGAIGPAGRGFQVSGSAGFSAQGGASSGCAIPSAATAIAVDLAAVNESRGGYLKAYPTGQSAPNASVLNYGTAALANELTLAITPGTGKGLTVTASTPTQVFGDVTGYYEPQLEAYVLGDGSLNTSTSRALSASTSGTGDYVVTFDTNVYFCTANATAIDPGLTASAYTQTSGQVTVHVRRSTDGSQANDAFNLVVTC